MTEPLRTPLADEHVELGAVLTEYAGWLMPLRYSSDKAEHLAVRNAAGLFDLTHMGEIFVRGPEAARALDHAVVGDMSAVKVGKAKYTMICTDDGSVIDDLIVYRLADDEFLVVANAANVGYVFPALVEACAQFECTAVDASLDYSLLAIQGPRALEILAPLTSDPAGLSALGYYSAAQFSVAGADAIVARTGYTGEDGFEVFVDNADAVQVWRALLDAGTPLGLVPAGLASRDSLRLEAGMPLYGHELDRTTTPYEARLGRVVALNKTNPDGSVLEFVGRTALRGRKASEPARILVGLKGLSRRAPRAGHQVIASTQPDRRAVVGRITSGAPSPSLGYPIAMAYVTPEFAGEGTELAVDVRGTPEPVVIVSLPFYRRPTERA